MSLSDHLSEVNSSKIFDVVRLGLLFLLHFYRFVCHKLGKTLSFFVISADDLRRRTRIQVKESVVIGVTVWELHLGIDSIRSRIEESPTFAGILSG